MHYLNMISLSKCFLNFLMTYSTWIASNSCTKLLCHFELNKSTETSLLHITIRTTSPVWVALYKTNIKHCQKNLINTLKWFTLPSKLALTPPSENWIKALCSSQTNSVRQQKHQLNCIMRIIVISLVHVCTRNGKHLGLSAENWCLPVVVIRRA